jgi:hypothetical protein
MLWRPSIHHLVEEASVIEQTHRYKRETKVRSFFTVVTGKDSKAARVLVEAFVKRVFGAEIGDRPLCQLALIFHRVYQALGYRQ